jgi:hypothetical protein
MKLRRPVVLVWILLLVLGLGSAGAFLWSGRGVSTPSGAAVIREPELKEASGLAPSLRTDDVYWSHNDSKGTPLLYGFGANGTPRGKLRIMGVDNIDWEGVTSFYLDGRAYLAIGDIGDNSARRAQVAIHVIEEPPSAALSAGHETEVRVAWSIKFQYEDGPRDAESLTVDVSRREFVIIAKRGTTKGIYTLPVTPATMRSRETARRIGAVQHLPVPNLFQRLIPSPTGRYRGQPTDASLSPDGLTLAVLTYGDVLLYHRTPGESWATAVTRRPRKFAEPGLRQAEAICFSPDGNTLLVTGEQHDPVLLQYSLTR